MVKNPTTHMESELLWKLKIVKCNKSTTTSLFNDDVTNLFALDQDALASADDLLYKLSLNLPVSFTAKKMDNRFYNIDKM